MKKILVPTDFSACADNAANIALSIAHKAHAKIDFIHLLKDKNESLADSPKAEINQWVQKANALGLKSDSFPIHGPVAKRIIEHAYQGNYDLIVMGSHQVTGVKSMFVKTNAQNVVRKSLVPVLVLKEETKTVNIENIVYASTFVEDLNSAWMKVISFADLFGAEIHLLYVNEEDFPQETKYIDERMEAFLKECPKKTCTKNIYNAGYPQIGILHFAEDKNMDLIALITHGQRGGLRKWEASLTERIVKEGNRPVLSVNINLEDDPEE